MECTEYIFVMNCLNVLRKGSREEGKKGSKKTGRCGIRLGL
jgi:hypothetical protein